LAVAVTLDSSDLHRISSDKYHEFIECGALDNAHVELIDGLICDMSPRTSEHDRIAAYLTRLLADRLNRAYQLRVASALTIGDSEPEPDFAVVRPGTPEPYHPATAELVIEVSLSSLRRDLIVKPRIYSSAGVPEYWVVDIEHSRVVVHREPARDGYGVRRELGHTESLDGAVVGIGEIPIAEILAAAQPRR
jgi:Uma2 family endonuclease